MRKKIGKRIGPVPIILAVFALAAFVSVGLLLASNTSSIQAQGMQPTSDPPPLSECAVAVAGDDDLTNDVRDENSEGKLVSGGGCKVTTDSVNVVFKNFFPTNTDGEIAANIVGAKASLAAYVTGGVQFPSVQAIVKNEDGDALMDRGKVGVDEHLLSLDAPSFAIGGAPTPGTKSVTVTSDMAEDGKVYLFAYIATANRFTVPGVTQTEADQGGSLAGTAVGIPLSSFVDDDKRSSAQETAAMVTAINFVANEINAAQTDAINDTALVTVNADDQSEQTFTLTNLDTVGDIAEVDLTLSTPRTAADVIDDAEELLDTADKRIRRIKAHSKYDDAEDDTKQAIVDAELAILMAQAGLDGIDHGAPQHFMNTTASITVLVEFQDPAVEKIGGATVSKVEPSIAASDGTSKVTVEVRDANRTALNGFIDLAIDESAGSSVVFTQSNLKTYHAPVQDGKATADIKGLPKSGPVRVAVTGTFGDLTLTGYVKREGAADSVTAMTYSCAMKIDGVSVEDDICIAEAGMKTADLTEATVFAPDDTFLIVGALKDSAGNTLDKRINAKQLKPSGVTQAITSIVNAQESEDEDAMVSEAQANARLIATIDDNEDRAALGSYDIEVSSSGQKMTVSITIAGDASQISIDGPDMIPTNTGLATYTVTATDVNGNVPADAGELDGKFTVAVRYKDAEVLGLADGKIDFNAKGVGQFQVLMPQEAVEGSRVSITVSYGTKTATKVVTYGDAPSEPGMPMNVMAEATSHDMITVSWESPAADGGSDITGYMVQSAYMMADDMMSDWMDVDPAHMGMDMMYMDMGLMAETTYYYRVTAMNAVGSGEATDGMAMAMTMAENMAPMAGDDVADQMVYVGAMVEVQSNFSDPDEDMLSYMATSDMMDVATATVDDMGMVTITGVAEGMATITVTASDPGELYAMQTIMVTVMMMPSMELGDPSITSVMSDADGMATVMLMPGDNATKHWAWAEPTDGSEGMWHGDSAFAGDATMVTFSGLTSGMNYWFIAIAGRGTGTDSEWSAWSGWTAEKSIQ